MYKKIGGFRYVPGGGKVFLLYQKRLLDGFFGTVYFPHNNSLLSAKREKRVRDI